MPLNLYFGIECCKKGQKYFLSYTQVRVDLFHELKWKIFANLFKSFSFFSFLRCESCVKYFYEGLGSRSTYLQEVVWDLREKVSNSFYGCEFSNSFTLRVLFLVVCFKSLLFIDITFNRRLLCFNQKIIFFFVSTFHCFQTYTRIFQTFHNNTCAALLILPGLNENWSRYQIKKATECD